MARNDYAFPFRIDAGSSQAAQAPYPAHVDQMIRQVLLTSPGERVCLPDFGCGLRRLVFAGQSDALAATVAIQVRQSLTQWLSDQVSVVDVEVLAGATAPAAAQLDQGEILITVSYQLVETQTTHQVSVLVR